MKNQAQARRNARGATLPSSRANLYGSQSVSVTSAKFFQKFDQLMFPSPKRDKPIQATSVSKDYNDNPKDFQVEIEERYQQVSSRRSYSFPRQSAEKREVAEMQKTNSSESSADSLKHATVYNLYSQNPHANLESPKIPSILLEEHCKQKNANAEIKKTGTSKINRSIDKEIRSKRIDEKVEERVEDNSKKLSENNTPSSYRKLVSMIETQLNRMSDRKQEAIKDTMQQNWTKTWLGIMSGSSRNVNKTLCANLSGFSQSSSVVANDNQKFLNSFIEEPKKEKQQTRDIDKIGKSSHYLRASSRSKQGETNDIRVAKSNKMLPKQDNSTGAKSSFMKTLGVKNLNVSTRPLSNWDFSLVKSPNFKRSVSPKTNTTIMNANKISLKAPKKEEKQKPGPIKILDEEDQQKFFQEQLKAMNAKTEKRSKENNASLLHDSIQQEKVNKEPRKRKPVNSFCHFPGNDFTQLLKTGFISPTRNMSKDSASKREIPKSPTHTSPITKPQKKRIQSNNIENHVPGKAEKSHVNVSNEHKKGKKSMEIQTKKDQKNSSPTNRKEKAKGSHEVPQTNQHGKSQNYSLFAEEDGRKEMRHKTPTAAVSKSTILKTLFINRVRK